MPESDDIALLKEYAENGSEPAFTTLVGRHVNLVYSAALRSTGNRQAAEDIAQAVFIILARKAKSLGAKTVLSGWLYQTVRLTAANYRRGEIRRQKREQEAYMETTLNEPAPEAWPQIAPLLEDAMGRLGEKDRNAIVLRYFENKNLSEVGAALGASGDAAKMRVNRALEKLRSLFRKRGVDSTAAAIGETISANSIQAAPVALAKSISAVAVAKGAAAGGSTLTLVKGALKIMAWTKAKTAVVAATAVILSAGTYPAVEKVIQARTAAQGKEILTKVVAANRYWLLAPPDTVTKYSYVFHLDWQQAPGGLVETPVQVTNPRNAKPEERQGITYSSLLQRLAKTPEQVQVKSVTEKDGKITLALKVLPAPGSRTSFIVNGQTFPIAPLRIDCGNGISQRWRGQFQTGGTNAVLVVDAGKMVPLSSVVTAYQGTVEETFSDYAEASPGNYVPLSVTVTNTGMPKGWQAMVFAWKFKLQDGLWLFDESQYQGKKVAWTDQVVVN